MKRVINICESSINRDDVHMMVQCDKCSKCRTCRDIRKINASSYNDFVEQQAMEQLVEFIEGKDGKPGHFSSPLPLKPFNINSVKSNRDTADEQNRRMLEKLQSDPEALRQIKEEMENLQKLGFIAKLEDMPEDVQARLNNDIRHYIPTSIAYKETSASTKCRICWDSSRSSKESSSLNSVLLKGTSEYSVVKMLVRFRENRIGVSADIRKFYNTLKLDPSHYKFHMALWRPNMLPEEDAIELVLLVHFYGVRSSGGLCMAAVKKLIDFARKLKLENVAKVLESAYVDDCNSSVATLKEGNA